MSFCLQESSASFRPPCTLISQTPGARTDTTTTKSTSKSGRKKWALAPAHRRRKVIFMEVGDDRTIPRRQLYNRDRPMCADSHIFLRLRDSPYRHLPQRRLRRTHG